METFGDLFKTIVEQNQQPEEKKEEKWKKVLPRIEEEFKKRNLDIQYEPISIPMVLAKCMTHESIGNRGVLLTGCTGCGKTERIKILADLGYVRMVNAYDLAYEVANVKDTDSKRNLYNYPEYMNHSPRQYDLIIDDLGAENEAYNVYGNRGDTMALILQERYIAWKRFGAMTCATTNLSVAELKKRYTEREFSRLADMFTVVTLLGDDRRIENNKSFQF